MAISRPKIMKYYIQGSTLSFEEDMTHEFKGHRNLCEEELPEWAKKTKVERASRKPVSRNLNAFLNSGQGGTVYLGVTDDGQIHGLKLNEFQKEHFRGSLDDLLSRYEPPVAQHRYKVRFVPVVGKASTKEEIIQICMYNSNQNVAGDVEYSRKHEFRTPNYCWCDKESTAQYNCGIIAPDYVIEVVIKPWKTQDPRNRGEGTVVNIHPLHKDETGKIYFRQHASVVQYSLNSIVQTTRQDVKDQCEAEISRLKQEIAAFTNSPHNSLDLTHEEGQSLPELLDINFTEVQPK